MLQWTTVKFLKPYLQVGKVSCNFLYLCVAYLLVEIELLENETKINNFKISNKKQSIASFPEFDRSVNSPVFDKILLRYMEWVIVNSFGSFGIQPLKSDIDIKELKPVNWWPALVKDN